MNGLIYLTQFPLRKNFKYMANKFRHILKNKMKKLFKCIVQWKKEVILIIYNQNLAKKFKIRSIIV